jgi:DNA-binding CsgD family transcriptional regulator
LDDGLPRTGSISVGGHTPRLRGTIPLAAPARTPTEGAVLATLDKLNRGVLLVTAVGRIIIMNRAAAAMLSRGGGLAVHANRLEFRNRTLRERYAAFLAQATDGDGGTSLVLRASGPLQLGDYRVLVSPLDDPSAEDGPSHCIFIYEPDAGRRRLPLKVLAQLYGLAPAEARFTNELFVGKSVQQAAGEVGVTGNTARSTLKRIFAKCSVSSQAELLQLLALGPRTL